MIKNIAFIFNPEYYDRLESDFSNRMVDFDFWGILNIMVDGGPFFEKYNFQVNNGPLGSSSMSKKGITVPMYIFLEELSKVPQKLRENGTFIVENDQISKAIIFCLRNDSVTFAIFKNDFYQNLGERVFYDGEKVSNSVNIPQTEKNVISFDVFKQCLKESLESFLEILLEKFPKIKNLDYIKTTINRVKEIK